LILPAFFVLWPQYEDSASQGAKKILWVNAQAGLGLIIMSNSMIKFQITIEVTIDNVKIISTIAFLITLLL
jgi:hypothetical protein